MSDEQHEVAFACREMPTLSDVIVRMEIGQVDYLEPNPKATSFMRIDVEGFASAVIRGRWGAIQKHQHLILIEQLDSEFVGGSTECIESLKKTGYSFWRHQPCATTRGWPDGRKNTARYVLLGGKYDYHFNNRFAASGHSRDAHRCASAIPVSVAASRPRGCSLSGKAGSATAPSAGEVSPA
jgi:hypothetical protein